MEKIKIADAKDIDNIVRLRVEMQIEDWYKTTGIDFSKYKDDFYSITKKHIKNKLNVSLYFAIMYIDEKAIAICGIEELYQLPQITICSNSNGRNGNIISVYTKPEFRRKKHQQKLLKYLINFSKDIGFSEFCLTTNTPNAEHIYKKLGFVMISNKYHLSL